MTDKTTNVHVPFGMPFYFTNVEVDTTPLLEYNGYTKGATQIGPFENNLRVLEEFPIIRDYLTNEFNDFMRAIDMDAEFLITTSWITFTKKGDRIQQHNHANSYYSGLLYFGEYSANSGGISFLNPLRIFSQGILPDVGPAPVVRPITVQPNHNDLIFFPSCIEHLCESVGEDRFSLAFNLMPKSISSNVSRDSYYEHEWFNK
mgnify:FL=1|tara:strand:- start:185 stop:793 length:609 start_codon:yes stop_codon:yes gene_type:complete